jgi:hypothetical protein
MTTSNTIKQFNTVGVCVPEEHYMLPVLSRIPDINDMIEGKFYFIIHAPRQSGKTTFLDFLTDKINSEGIYYAIYCSLATLRGINDKNEAMTAVVTQINFALLNSQMPVIRERSYSYNTLPELSAPAEVKVRTILNRVCEELDKDLIVFFDEADCISGSGLMTFLAQIRDGYLFRHKTGNKFPRSMALVGMRDIREYHKKNSETDLTESSPFNIKKEALTLPNFSMDEIKTLYEQHTKASGQSFEESAISRAWYWSEGQPWLINALAYEIINKILGKDYSIPITDILIDQAADLMIKRRDTHIDSLVDRLKEPRVARVMDSVFASTLSYIPFNDDDRQYCIDLGLVVSNNNNELRPANAIYREVMVRVITDQIKDIINKTVPELPWTNGKIIFLSDLLKEFQRFWRKGSLSFPMRKKDFIAYQYDEALYSFILEAFLQRLFNSKAQVLQQLSEGRGAVDIGIIYNKREYIIEIKLKDHQTTEESLSQLARYLDTNGEKEGWLVIFDRSPKKKWEEKIYWNITEFDGKTIHVVGC